VVLLLGVFCASGPGPSNRQRAETLARALRLGGETSNGRIARILFFRKRQWRVIAATSERVGEAIHLALTAPKPKARYAVVTNRLVDWTLPILLPKRVVDRLIANRLGSTRRSIAR
jgi:hypothetical protein